MLNKYARFVHFFIYCRLLAIVHEDDVVLLAGCSCVLVCWCFLVAALHLVYNNGSQVRAIAIMEPN